MDEYPRLIKIRMKANGVVQELIPEAARRLIANGVATEVLDDPKTKTIIETAAINRRSQTAVRQEPVYREPVLKGPDGKVLSPKMPVIRPLVKAEI